MITFQVKWVPLHAQRIFKKVPKVLEIKYLLYLQLKLFRYNFNNSKTLCVELYMPPKLTSKFLEFFKMIWFGNQIKTQKQKRIKGNRGKKTYLGRPTYLAQLTKPSPAHRGAGSSSSSCQEDSTGEARVHVVVPPPASTWRPSLASILRLEAPRVFPSHLWPN